MTTSLVDEMPDARPDRLAALTGRLDRAFGLPVSEALVQDIIPGFRAVELWGMLGWDDIRQRYRRSIIGPFWITLSVTVFITILSLIYSRVMAMDVVHYMPYFSLGFIMWNFISTTLNEACRSFQESERTIKQIKLPFTIYMLRVVWRNFIVLLHTIGIFVPIAIFCSVPVGWISFLALPGLVLVCFNVAWLTLALAIVGTRFRDFIQIVQTAIQILMFATPILWTVQSLGGSTLIADVNPLYHLVEIVRAPLLGNAPETLSWFVAAGLAVVGWIATTLLLARTVRRIVFWL